MSDIKAFLINEDDAQASLSFEDSLSAQVSVEEGCSAQVSFEDCPEAVLTFDGYHTILDVVSDEAAQLSLDTNITSIEIGGVMPFGGGEANTAINVGGFFEVYQTKVGAEFRFRTLQSSDASVLFTQNIDDINMVIDPFAVIDLFKYGVTPIGDVDGINTTFEVPEAFVDGTLRLYIRGQRLMEGVGCDYQLSGTTISLDNSIAPRAGDVIMVDYISQP